MRCEGGVIPQPGRFLVLSIRAAVCCTSLLDRGVGMGAESELWGDDTFSCENREAAVTKEAQEELDDAEADEVFELRIELFCSSCQQLRSRRLMPALTAAAVAATTAWALH